MVSKGRAIGFPNYCPVTKRHLFLIPEGNLKRKHRVLVAFQPRSFLRAVEWTVMHTTPLYRMIVGVYLMHRR